MRILFIIPYTPSLIRVRPYQLLRHLVRRGHEVTLMTLWSGSKDQANLEELVKMGVDVRAFRLPSWRPVWNCTRAIFSRLPLQAAFCWQPQLATELALMIQKSRFDVVHVEHLRGALFGLHLVRLLRTHATCNRASLDTPVVWDSVDCISYLFGQAKRKCRTLKGRSMTRLEERRTKHYEGWLVRQFDHVLITSEVDLRELKRLALQNGFETDAPFPVSVLSNGVDLEYFCPSDERRDPATLVFSGKMSYHANVTSAIHLVRDVMPIVWADRPDVRIKIVGKDPPREISRLSSIDGRQTSGALNCRDRVEVTGEVTDLRPYLRTATAAVVPLLYGAGIQNKVLEAMACATPVISSPLAVSALKVQAGREVLLGEGAQGLADRILHLLEDQGAQQELGAKGRSYVASRHDWNSVAQQLERVYTKVKESKARVSSAA